MRNTKKTAAYYWRGYEDGKVGKKKQLPSDNGMACRLYRDGYRDANEGRVSR